MNDNRKKELLLEYKNRKPQMGVISYKCLASGESFLGVSKDTRADFNSMNVNLDSGFHPNRRLLTLWKEYGRVGFEIAVLEELKYDYVKDNVTLELEALREKCLAADEKASKIWK